MDLLLIRENSEVGKFAVASKSLKSGEIFLEELPFAVGPKPSSTCLCLECFCPLNGADGPRCEKCSWPICEQCSKNFAKKYHKFECKIFSDADAKFFNLSDPNGVCMQLDCITPLRVILEKERNPEKWKCLVENMEDHREKRFESEIWKVDEQNVVKYLLGPCMLKTRNVDSELIHKVIGILNVNAFEAKTLNNSTIRCLFPRFAMLSHSCVPNTTHSIHPSKDFKLVGRVTTTTSQHSELFDTYTYTLTSTFERQNHLMKGKYFECKCERCRDTTELETYFNALKCTKCQKGFIIPTSFMQESSQWKWKCEGCEMTKSFADVKELQESIQNEIDSSKSIEMLELLLTKCQKILHPNHSLIISIKNILIELYGHVKGYQLCEMSDEMLQRKVDFCNDILEILDKFEPGKSRSRALVMYEMQSAMIFLFESRYLSGEDSEDELLKNLNYAKGILIESLEIISWEDENLFSIINEMKSSLEILNEKIHLSDI